MRITSKIMKFTTKHRETLIKLIPIGILRKIKANMIQRNLKKAKKQGRTPFDAGEYPFGINFIGDVKAEIGLGQSARLLVNGIKHSKIPFTIFQLDIDGVIRANDCTYQNDITQMTPYGINLFHINPYELGIAYSSLGKDVWEKRYNIAFWLWELEEFPEEWKTCFPLVDEVWTPSEFTSNSIRKVIDVPVKTIPYHVIATKDETYDRAYFGLPEDQFLFLSMYDCNSTMDRKNPMGVIDAYKNAFSVHMQHGTVDEFDNPIDVAKVGLVLKINNVQGNDLSILQEAMKEYPNVYYITNALTKTEVNSLISDVDVFVSLHRAEGFGLVMAEAMLNETLCIASNWSSNTEFMNEEVAYMVPCDIVEIQKTNVQYKQGYHWAEPDVDVAASYMRDIVEHPEKSRQMAIRAKTYIEEKLSLKKQVALIEERVAEIYGQ